MAHAERVSVYSVAVGERLGLDDASLAHLADAAMLHDVGKVRVDQDVLQKIGRLDEDEWRALRLHSELCVHVIEEFDFLAPCVPWIRHHHEAWDGTGYPDGLAGGEIPLESRIIAVCEAFDVVAHGSAWRSPDLEGFALEEIQACSGKQFDPEIVKTFCEIESVIQPLV